ncbi:MAG: nitroreductase [Burkholderiales bacterium]|nr:nitroreductase [Burkholderiales bacterium]MDE2077625.1 nitroreductase [Burkholderiales bacterium]HET8695550.1 nitroreductase [Aquabacterium sp.]
MTHPASVPREPDHITTDTIAAVDHAITTRRSIRRFLSKAVSKETIEEILKVASRAPSGTNTQPWRVHVLTGASRQSLVDKIMAIHNDPAQLSQHQEEYDYYPKEWVSPYIDRRRKVGWDMYGIMGIAKGDKERMHAQQGRNYQYFDAPVGLVFTIDRIMGRGSWLDYGMFLQNIMVAARARGLDTCPQAAFNHFHDVIESHLGLNPEKEMVVVSMALGYADPDSIDNTLLTEREPVDAFTKFWD